MAEEFRRAGKTHLADCLLLFVLPVWTALHFHPADPVRVKASPSSLCRGYPLAVFNHEAEENQSRD